MRGQTRQRAAIRKGNGPALFNVLSPKSSRSRSGYVVAAAQFAAVMPIPILVLIPEKAPLRETTRIGPVTISDVHRLRVTRSSQCSPLCRGLVLTVPTFETLRSLARAAFFCGPEVAQSTPKKWRVNANVDAFDGEVLRYRKRW